MEENVFGVEYGTIHFGAQFPSDQITDKKEKFPRKFYEYLLLVFTFLHVLCLLEEKQRYMLSLGTAKMYHRVVTKHIKKSLLALWHYTLKQDTKK
ncbi:CLUMA_CG009803, isoform A [Clunio marinus]|uniref:CLUMA_CG009803, isoform A n=1 Tax=Clunio marinus TaxID=568069 RepID=A0A1J1I9H9_9DIPT|nr:CLUMA_CG009803, isoform A [Clunio marinus]